MGSKKNKRTVRGMAQAVTQSIPPATKAMVKKMVKDTLNNSGQSLGQKLGSHIGMANAGGQIGRLLAGRISRLIGSGDYTSNEGSVVTNSLIRGKVPATISFDGRSVRLTHREFIGDISTGPVVGGFAATTFTVNPSEGTTFPYLANVATLFEKYRFNGLVFETISTCSPYLSSSSMGAIIIAAQFNNQNTPFTTKTQMENCENAVSARLDKSVMYGVECKDQVQNMYYTRHNGSSPALTVGTANIYDLANVSVATSGGAVAANTTVAELWVTYDVELCGPRMPDVRSWYVHGRATTVNAANPLGQSLTRFFAYGGGENATVTGDTISLNNFNTGDVILLSVYYPNVTAITMPAVVLTGCTNFFCLAGGTTAEYIPGYTVGTQTATYTRAFTITSPGATIAFAGGGVFTGATTAEFVMTSIGYGVLAGRM